VEASGGLGAKNTERPGISASPPIRGWSSSYFRELLRLVLSRISAEAGGVLSALKSAPGARKQAVGENCLEIRQEATESLQVLVHLLC